MSSSDILSRYFEKGHKVLLEGFLMSQVLEGLGCTSEAFKCDSRDL